MTSENFSRPGAVDLSELTAKSDSSTTGRFVIELDENKFNQVVSDSLKYPVVLEFYSPQAPAKEVSDKLFRLAEEGAGQFLLARVNIQTSPRIAQAMGIQAVPTVVAVIGGQVAPLFQGTKEPTEIEQLISAVKQSAIANGITGRATAQAPVAQENGQVTDPRFTKAESFLDNQDYAGALAEYERILASTPNDLEAISGKALAELLLRSTKFDPLEAQVKAADSSDIENQLNLADLELIQGQPKAAFDRIINLISETVDEDEREKLRLRILDLFEVVGKTDPIVVKARRQLSTALFTH